MLLSTFIVATIPSSSVSSSASSFEWICSTEAAPWRNYTANASLRTAPLCTPQPHTNCHGGKDLSMSRAPTTAAACCAYCGTVAGCAAWTFDTTASHVPFCYAKTACPTPDTADPNTVSGFGQPAPPTPAPPVSLHINTSDVRQTMEGFGGCFNEKGWDALTALSPTDRLAVLEALFSMETGLKYGLNRMPIGSSDFADGYYSLCDGECEGDYGMTNLSLARDHTKLIQYIQAAMAVQPGLRLWGSPWTGPEWLKDSGKYGCGSLRTDNRSRTAYALYLARAAKAYRAAGLQFEALAIQNEPNQGTVWTKEHGCTNSYPKMHWTGEQLRVFLRDYLGPIFEAEGMRVNERLCLKSIILNYVLTLTLSYYY